MVSDECERIGDFDEQLRSHEDWQYTCRVLQQQLVIRQLPNALMVIRNHSEPRASDFSKTHADVVGKLQAAASVETSLPDDPDFRRALVLRLAVNAYRCLLVSIMLPDQELADASIQALRRNIAPWMPFSFRCKMRALDAVYSLFGCKGATWFWGFLKRLASFPALKKPCAENTDALDANA